jgi:predicted RNA-binding protein associated with RNAse of E/G family
MTYKRADRPGWPRLRAQRFVCQRIGDEHVSGYVTLLRMVEVAEPLWVTHHEQRVCIADVGYSWLQIFPEGASHTHTTMFDAEGQPVQDYIDLVAEQGVAEDGVPWYDDLYLDITWIAESAPLLLDQEELEAAHAIGAISQEQYDLARGEAAQLLVALTLGDYRLPEIARACYPALSAALDASEQIAQAGQAESAEPTELTEPAEAAEESAEPAAAEVAVANDESGEAAEASQAVEVAVETPADEANEAEQAAQASSTDDTAQAPEQTEQTEQPEPTVEPSEAHGE